MRGHRLLKEAGRSQYVCPSCTQRTASDGVVKGAGLLFAREPSVRVDSRRSRFPKSFISRELSITASTRRPELRSPGPYVDPSLPPAPPHPENDIASYGSARERSVLREHELLALIEEGQPGRIMAAFMEPMNRLVLHSLPPAAFAEVLHLLSPSYFVEPYKDILERLYNVTAGAKRLKHVRAIFSHFSRSLMEVVDARRHAGRRLGIAEYTHLLNCARSMGNADMADVIWEDMAFDSLEPNLECYNYYMEAKVWHDTYFVKQSHRLRAIPWNYRHRSYHRRSSRWTGYRTGEGGTQDEVRALFKEMVDAGLEPDTASYIQLMTAASRNCDLGTVKGILGSVWNVHVDVIAQDASGHPPVTEYSPSSPLQPTEDLLYAVAHIFCSNNEFVTALQLVDFLSARYGIPIPQRVWKHLLSWSFVLSKKRAGRKNSQDEMVGRIPRTSVLSVFKTMTADYDIAPTLRAIDILAKTGWDRQVLDNMISEMRTGRNLLFDVVSKRDFAGRFFHSLAANSAELRPELTAHDRYQRPDHQYVDLDVYRELIPRSGFDDGLHWHSFNEFQTQQMAAIRSSIYVERWVKLLLSRNKWPGGPYHYERNIIPYIISEWKDFLPTQVFYQTTGGQVEFDMTTIFPKGVRTNPAHLTPLPLAREGAFQVGELAVANTQDIPQASREWRWIRVNREIEALREARLADRQFKGHEYPNLEPTMARPQVRFRQPLRSSQGSEEPVDAPRDAETCYAR